MKGIMTLMHRDDKVALLHFDNDGGLDDIREVYNEELMPPGIKNVYSLIRWLTERSLAINRQDLACYREFYGVKEFISGNGLSLSDSYWFAKKDIPSWDGINPYDNWSPDNDFLNMLFLHPEMSRRLFLMEDFSNTPNFAVPGTEPRIWYRNKGKIIMLNRNARNDMAVWKAAARDEKYKRLVLPRYYAILGEYIYSVLTPQTSKDVELIPFTNYYCSIADKDKEQEENIKLTCETYNLPGWKDYFSTLFAFDRETGKTDRELSDIGVLRDVETLTPISFASI